MTPVQTTPIPDSFFGSEAQRDLLTRGRALFDLLRDDPRFTYYGRGVGLVSPEDGDFDLLLALTRLQAFSHYGIVSDARLSEHTEAAHEAGLSVTLYPRWEGGDAVLRAAREILQDHSCPGDITVVRITPETPDVTLAQLAEVALGSGVLPPAGAVLRGQTRPGLGLVALDGAGKPVACAGAAAYLHPSRDGHAWWGMLATDPARRGEKLALILGAMAIEAMHEGYGFRSFFTGVEAGNTASEGLCARIGLAPGGTSTLSVADPSMLPGGRMTK